MVASASPGPKAGARKLLTVVLAAAVGLLAGCTKTPPPNPATPPNTIVINDFGFYPRGLVVRPGTQITVINQDPVAHTLTAVDKLFNTGDIAPGQRTTLNAPTAPDIYRYLSMDQQYMTGFLRVIGPGGT